VETCEHCNLLKSKWDLKLKKNNFEDAEKNKLLKKWTGIEIHYERPTSLIDIACTQEPLEPIKSTWPEPNFSVEETLLNNPDLEDICESLCGHGNHLATSQQMVAIWKAHCEGDSLRTIEKKFKIHNVTVYRIIKKLREVSKL